MGNLSQNSTKLAFEKQIVEFVKEHPSSLNQIAEHLDLNYYTCRNYVTELNARNVLKIVGMVDRHRIYGFNGDEDKVEFIPRVTDLVKKHAIKVHELLAIRGRENDMKAIESVRLLPLYVAQLLSYAQLAYAGQDVKFSLSLTREQMQKQYIYMRNMTSLYDQILSDPRFWNPDHLSEIPRDKDYDSIDVQETLKYYAEVYQQ